MIVRRAGIRNPDYVGSWHEAAVVERPLYVGFWG